MELGEEPLVSQFAFHLRVLGYVWLRTRGTVCSGNFEETISTVNNPRLLKIIVFLNVVFTLIPAILVSVNMLFEIFCHEIEYFGRFMSFVELVLLVAVRRVRGRRGHINDRRDRGSASMIDSSSPSYSTIHRPTISLLQLGIYNGLGRTRRAA